MFVRQRTKQNRRGERRGWTGIRNTVDGYEKKRKELTGEECNTQFLSREEKRGATGEE